MNDCGPRYAAVKVIHHCVTCKAPCMLSMASCVSGGNAPVILEHLNDVHVKEGEHATFECRITGKPQPSVVW